MRSRDWKLIVPHAYRALAGHKPGMDGWPGEYFKQPVLEPELYNRVSDIEEQHNVAAQYADVVAKMLEQAEQCHADLGDTTLDRKGAGVRAPGGTKE